jgi:hypothetical protein
MSFKLLILVLRTLFSYFNPHPCLYTSYSSPFTFDSTLVFYDPDRTTPSGIAAPGNIGHDNLDPTKIDIQG